MTKTSPKVAIIMGSDSDWPTMKLAAQMLADFGVSYEAQVVSAHRTPDLMFEFAETASAKGIQVIIAGAGGAAHLPVLGVPVASKHLQGNDSLLSIVQMPKGIPVATFAIGDAGATNAGLFAVSILANSDVDLAKKLEDFRAAQTAKVLNMTLTEQP
jgi:5-(carboxyamino)imidazole ribonucleotide mutase